MPRTFFLVGTGVSVSFLFKILFIFLERGEGREKERVRNIDMQEKIASCTPSVGDHATQACALTGN